MFLLCTINTKDTENMTRTRNSSSQSFALVSLLLIFLFFSVLLFGGALCVWVFFVVVFICCCQKAHRVVAIWCFLRNIRCARRCRVNKGFCVGRYEDFVIMGLTDVLEAKYLFAFVYVVTGTRDGKRFASWLLNQVRSCVSLSNLSSRLDYAYVKGCFEYDNHYGNWYIYFTKTYLVHY